MDRPHPIYGDRRPSRDECIAEGGAWLAGALAEQDALSPRQAAERAHVDGGPSVEVLEDFIRAERGLPALNRTKRGAA